MFVVLVVFRNQDPSIDDEHKKDLPVMEMNDMSRSSAQNKLNYDEWIVRQLGSGEDQTTEVRIKYS